MAGASDVAIVGGVAKNYRGAKVTNVSRQKDLVDESPSRRVMGYYKSLGNNAIFYGLMRRSVITTCVITKTLGADWLLMAQVAFQGKMLTNPDVAIHRERENSASRSVANLVKVMGLPRVQAVLPITSIAMAAARDVLRTDAVYGGLPTAERRTLAAAVARIVFVRLGVWVRMQTLALKVIGHERAARWQARVTGNS
jgi:hypothetical protein